MFTDMTLAVVSASSAGTIVSSTALSEVAGGVSFPPQPLTPKAHNAVIALSTAHKNFFILSPLRIITQPRYIFNAAENSVPLKNFKEMALTAIKGKPEIMYIAYNTP